MPDWLKRVCALAAKGLGQLLTEKDNATLDIKRVGGALALVYVMACKGYDLIGRHGDLRFEETCTGLAVVIGTMGASIAINRHTETGG